MWIEAGPQGWSWSAPAPDGDRMAIAFVDVEALREASCEQREALYVHWMRSATLFRPLFAGLRVGGLVIRDATCREAAGPRTMRAVHAGDAALAMDPLSGLGLQAALRGGVHAAAIAHTILSDGDAFAAMEFRDRAHAEQLAAHLRHVAAFHAEQGDARDVVLARSVADLRCRCRYLPCRCHATIRL